MQDQYQDIQKFTDFITGDGGRRDKLEAALKGEEDGGDVKGKKKKKRNECACLFSVILVIHF
jgi:hypothetical protein